MVKIVKRDQNESNQKSGGNSASGPSGISGSSGEVRIVKRETTPEEAAAYQRIIEANYPAKKSKKVSVTDDTSGEAWTRATPSQTKVPSNTVSRTGGGGGRDGNVQIVNASKDGTLNPSPVQRVVKTVTGGLKQSAGATTDLLRTLYESHNDSDERAMSVEAQKNYADQAARFQAEYEQMLADNQRKPGTWSQQMLDNYRQRAEMAQAAADKLFRVNNQNVKQGTAREVAGIADRITESGAQDIQRAKQGAGFLGELLVDAGASTVQVGADLAANAALGMSGMIPFFLRAAGGGTQKARQDGADLKGQLAYGGLTAAKEVFTEKMFNIAAPYAKAYGKGFTGLEDAIEGGIRMAVDKFAKTETGARVLGGVLTGGASMLTEGLEELIGDWMEWQMPRVYGGDVASAQETLSESLYDFLVGAVSGGFGAVMDGGTWNYDTTSVRNRNENAAADREAENYYESLKNGIFAQNPEQVRASTEKPIVYDERAQEDSSEGLRRGVQETIPDPDESIRQQQEYAAPQDERQREAWRTRNIRTIQDAASTLGENGAKAITTAYDGSADTEKFYDGFVSYYNAGLSGKSAESVQGRYSSTLSEAQKYAAYTSGQNDAAASLARERRAAQYASVAGTDSGLVFDDYVASALDTTTADQVNSIAKALGVRVRFVDSVRGGTANAQVSGSDILLEKNNPTPAMFLLGHEWTHRMQELAPDQYRAFRDTVAEEAQGEVRVLLDQYHRAGEDISYEAALDEAAANYAGKLIEGGKVLDDFIEKHRDNRTLLEKVRDAIRSIISKLTGAERRQAQTAEGKLTAALEASAKQASALQGKRVDGTMGATRNSLKEDMENGRAREESREDFKRRCNSEGYSVYEGGAIAYGYRPVQGKSAGENARQVQKEVKSLGVDADIIDGPILWNYNGITSVRDVPQAVTAGGRHIFISNSASLPPRNMAGHEAFHLWKNGVGRDVYIDTVVDNLLFTSEAFREYQSSIAEAYLGDEADLKEPLNNSLCPVPTRCISRYLHLAKVI